MSIRKSGYKRNIRIERKFGENYTVENIKNRIISEQAIRVPFVENVYNFRKINYHFGARHRQAKKKGFIALYYHYCYLLKVFPQKVPQQKLPVSIRADVLKMEEISNQAKFLAKNKINTLDSREKGASETYKRNLENVPALLEYRRTYQKKIMNVSRNKEDKNLKNKFDKWKKEAQEKIKLFKKDELSEADLYDWMIKNK